MRRAMPAPPSRRANATASAFAGIVCAVLLHGCQSETAPTMGAACTYQQVVPCGTGKGCTAQCLPDLSDYGPCVCGDAGTDGGDAGRKDAR